MLLKLLYKDTVGNWNPYKVENSYLFQQIDKFIGKIYNKNVINNLQFKDELQYEYSYRKYNIRNGNDRNKIKSEFIDNCYNNRMFIENMPIIIKLWVYIDSYYCNLIKQKFIKSLKEETPIKEIKKTMTLYQFEHGKDYGKTPDIYDRYSYGEYLRKNVLNKS